MKKLILAAAAALFLFSTPVFAGDHTPPGNDGGFCHGANKASCRPDPQPSHGQDCKPHGNNHDGNVDHCGPSPSASVAPSPSASGTPSTEPTITPTASVSPSVTPSEPGVDVGGGNPDITPPPTDTASASVASARNPIAFVAFILIASFACFQLLPKRR